MESINRMLAMALNTFKEAARNRAFIGLMLGALAMILASLIMSEMVVFDQRKRVVQDFGLFFISFAGVVISVIIGILLVFKELERKTIYSLLSKPVRRYEFIAGRYLGMLLVLLVVVAALALAWYAVMVIRDVPIQLILVKAVILVLAELSVVSAVALLFSAFSTPILSGIFTFGIFIVGREVYLVEELLLARKGLFVSAPQLRPLGHAVTRIFPDLSMFDISREVLLEASVSWTYVFQSVGYAAAYVLILVILAAAVFQRRDFV